jgi:hypothetical protein
MHPDGPINIMDIREIIDRSALFALKRKTKNSLKVVVHNIG